MQPFQVLTQLLDGIMFILIGSQFALSYAAYGRLDIEFLTFVNDTETNCSIAAGKFWFDFYNAAKPPQYFVNLQLKHSPQKLLETFGL